MYRKIREHVAQHNPAGWELNFLTTERAGHAGEIARELLRRPPDLLVVCGGDGTLNEVATQIPDAPFPVAIVPAGTANVVARELRLPLDPARALSVGLKRSFRRVDLGNLGPGPKRRFLFVAGIGFDAYVASSVNPRLKSMIGIGSYAYAIARCLQSYSFPEFRVEAGGRTFTATSCLVCNARSYGGKLLFCPDADMSNGRLDVLVLEGRRRLGLAWFLLKARLQRPETGEWIHRFHAESVRIEGPPSICVQTDGELCDSLPLEISLTPNSFPLVVP